MWMEDRERRVSRIGRKAFEGGRRGEEGNGDEISGSQSFDVAGVNEDGV